MRMWLWDFARIYKRLLWSGAAMLVILAIGTVGYWFIGEQQYSFLDSLYMTVITVATIGYGEVIDLSHSPAGRVFTMIIAVVGIGLLSYMMTNFTALVVEGELTKSFKRRDMERIAAKSRDHYVLCGIGNMGLHILNELRTTGRPHVVVEMDKQNVDRILESYRDETVIEGDATDSETLTKAGVERARGVFAVTGDDNKNLVICLTARQLNPSARVVARCNELKNSEKMKKVGADAVVSAYFIGGLRMASEMVRPTVVSFLDIMMRDKDKNLRVEELAVPATLAGKPLSSLGLNRFRKTLPMAVKTTADWVFHPPEDYVLKPSDVLVVMTTPEERESVSAWLAKLGGQ